MKQLFNSILAKALLIGIFVSIWPQVSLAHHIPDRFLPRGEIFWGPVESPTFFKANLIKLYPRFFNSRYEAQHLVISGKEIFNGGKAYQEEEFDEFRELVFAGRENVDPLILENFSYQQYLKSWAIQKIASAYLKRVLDLKTKNFAVKKSVILSLADFMEQKILAIVDAPSDFLDGREIFNLLQKKKFFKRKQFVINVTRQEKDFLSMYHSELKNIPDALMVELVCGRKNCWKTVDQKKAQQIFIQQWKSFLERMGQYSMDEDYFESIKKVITLSDFYDDSSEANDFTQLVELVKSSMLNLKEEETLTDQIKDYFSFEENAQFLAKMFAEKIFYFEYQQFREMLRENALHLIQQMARHMEFINMVGKESQKRPFLMSMTVLGDREFVYEQILSQKDTPLREKNYLANGVELTFKNKEVKNDFTAELEKRLGPRNSLQLVIDELLSETRFSTILSTQKEITKRGENSSVHNISQAQLDLIFNPIFSLMNQIPSIDYGKENLQQFVLFKLDELEVFQWPMGSKRASSLIDQKLYSGKTGLLYIDAIKSLMNEFPFRLQIDFCVHPDWMCIDENLKSLMINSLVEVKKRENSSRLPHYLDDFNPELLMKSL